MGAGFNETDYQVVMTITSWPALLLTCLAVVLWATAFVTCLLRDPPRWVETPVTWCFFVVSCGGLVHLMASMFLRGFGCHSW
jgi:hypothetical protein